MPKNYHAEYGEFGNKLNSRHIEETFDSINQYLNLDFQTCMVNNPLASKADFNSSSEAATFLKKPEDTMGSIISANDGLSKIQVKKSIEKNGKIEKFGRLSLLLPIYWYPSDDEEVSLTELN
jgi:hypothetical protein